MSFFLFFGWVGIGAEGRYGWFGARSLRVGVWVGAGYFLLWFVVCILVVPEGRIGWFVTDFYFRWRDPERFGRWSGSQIGWWQHSILVALVRRHLLRRRQ